jgi:Uma2 family endonuclease
MSVATARKIEPQTYFTYADYAKWDAYPRFELINGRAIEMSSPSWRHQEISSELNYQLRGFLRGKKCKVVAAPFDVRFNSKTRDDIVLQPDLLVVCDLSKIENGKHCLGAPDMAIEIVSESNSSSYMRKKFNIYMKSGVREYWVIDPDKGVVVHLLENEKYFTQMYSGTDKIPVHVLEGCEIDLSEMFEPDEEEIEGESNEESNADI